MKLEPCAGLRRDGRGKWLRLLLLGLCLLLPAPAQAQSLSLEAFPSLGNGASRTGWSSLFVRLHNGTNTQVSGSVLLQGKGRALARAPFSIPGKGRILVELPLDNRSLHRGGLVVVARSGDSILASLTLPYPRDRQPLLLDFSSPSRIAPALRDTSLPIHIRGRYDPTTLDVSSPLSSIATGDLLLPRFPGAYASALVVVARSEQIVGLRGPQLHALTTWLLGGGALALVISRPEDLRSPTLSALIGGPGRSVAASPSLRIPREFTISDGSSPSGSRPRTRTTHSSPKQEIADAFVGHAGGNLRASPWGSSASYGLGEVHLLAFDPQKEEVINDTWVKLSLLDLVTHAQGRQNHLALPVGFPSPEHHEADAIRKHLDPNEDSRWTVIVATILIIFYAVVAGPLSFGVATRRGKPLKALWLLPLWAGLAFGFIVFLGVLGRGVKGRVRSLALVEAGAGMSVGTGAVYRGFFTSSSDSLLIRTHARGRLLEVIGDEDYQEVLTVDRDGPRLEELRSRPWQTVVVQEHGAFQIGKGISLLRDASHQLKVVNRTGGTLKGVIIKPEGSDAFFFPEVVDGQAVIAPRGEALGSLTKHRLTTSAAQDKLEELSSDAWDAWHTLQTSTRPTAWWPEDVPVVMAEFERPDRPKKDSGLRVEREQAILRVVGYGGLP